jgi:ABC-type nitrate/sulfonate/bicarbonate transport system substrate-binding protein
MIERLSSLAAWRPLRPWLGDDPGGSGARPGRTRRFGVRGVTALALVLVVVAAGCAPPAGSPSSSGGAPSAPARGPATGSAGTTGGAPAQAAPVKVRAATVGLSGANIAAWVTQESGRFAANGLEVELTLIDASPTAVQAMIAGELQVLHVALGAVLDASLAGADLVMLAATAPALVFSLYATPEIRRVSDLRGKILGANRPGTTTHFAATYVLKDNGLEPGSDVSILPTGSVTNTLAALQSGQVAAGVISPPSTLKASAAGFHELVDLSYIEYHTNGMVMRREYVQGNRDVAKRYLTALVEGIARARQDKAFAKQVIGKYTDTTDDAVLEETYERYVPKLMQPIPYVTPGGVQVAIEEFSAGNPQAQGAQPERFYDNSILQEIERSGLVDRLYPR